MGHSRIESIEFIIRERDYAYGFDIGLGNKIYLFFERRKKNPPECTLNLKEENSTISLPLNLNQFHAKKSLEEIFELNKKDPYLMKGVVEDRCIFLARLCMNLQEERVKLFKNRLIKAKDLAFEYSKQFLEAHKYELKRLEALGPLGAQAMRNASAVFDKLTDGKVSEDYNHEIDAYSCLYLGWSFLKDASKDFSGKVYKDANFLEKTTDKLFGEESLELFGKRMKEVAHFYNQISEYSEIVEKELQLLVSRALFLYGIKINKIEQPKLGILKEKIKDKLENYKVPERFKDYL